MWLGRRARGVMAPLLVGLLMVGIGAPASGPSGARAAESTVAFEARVGDLGLQTPHVERGRSLDDVVEAVLPGRLFAPPRELGPVARADADPGTPLGALRADFSAWKSDDEAWIAANFAADDQEEIRAFLADPEMRAASRAGFARYGSVFVWGEVRQGGHALVLITYGQGRDPARGLVATFTEEGGAWKRTNALTADETMDIVWAAFRLGRMKAR
jgi:hypothetical protein